MTALRKLATMSIILLLIGVAGCATREDYSKPRRIATIYNSSGGYQAVYTPKDFYGCIHNKSEIDCKDLAVASERAESAWGAQAKLGALWFLTQAAQNSSDKKEGIYYLWYVRKYMEIQNSGAEIPAGAKNDYEDIVSSYCLGQAGMYKSGRNVTPQFCVISATIDEKSANAARALKSVTNACTLYGFPDACQMAKARGIAVNDAAAAELYRRFSIQNETSRDEYIEQRKEERRQEDEREDQKKLREQNNFNNMMNATQQIINSTNAGRGNTGPVVSPYPLSSPSSSAGKSDSNRGEVCVSRCGGTPAAGLAQRIYYEHAACVCQCMGNQACYTENINAAKSLGSNAGTVKR